MHSLQCTRPGAGVPHFSSSIRYINVKARCNLSIEIANQQLLLLVFATMLFSSVITTLSAFAALTFAESFTVRVSTSTVLDCSTAYGKKSVTPIPTVIKTTTKYSTACRGTSTVTPTLTITPPPNASTSTITQEVSKCKSLCRRKFWL